MSSAQLVLITAGNGFVGYAVLVGTLKAGVSVLLESIINCYRRLSSILIHVWKPNTSKIQ